MLEAERRWRSEDRMNAGGCPEEGLGKSPQRRLKRPEMTRLIAIRVKWFLGLGFSNT